MQKIIQSVSLTGIVTVLIVLTVIWLLKIIVKKERRSLFRGVMLLLFLTIVLFYLTSGISEEWSLRKMWNKIFPQQPVHIDYRIEKRTACPAELTRYIFREPYPRISLKMDMSGKYFYIKDTSSINAVLKELNLPLVNEGVPELSSITGSQNDVSLFRWDKYPRGKLTIEKTLCRDKNSLETYHCIVQITLSSH